jgi:hypothetical protein
MDNVKLPKNIRVKIQGKQKEINFNKRMYNPKSKSDTDLYRGKLIECLENDLTNFVRSERRKQQLIDMEQKINGAYGRTFFDAANKGLITRGDGSLGQSWETKKDSK